MDLVGVVESIPLKTDAHGVVRIGGTRVTLDTLVYEFEQGSTAEEIAYQFDVLNLSDVYAVIAYYLRHQNEVKAYLQEQDRQATEIREKIEQRSPSKDLRARLIAKHQSRTASRIHN